LSAHASVFQRLIQFQTDRVCLPARIDREYLAGKTVDFVNKKAFEGTMLAHTDGKVPNLIVNIPELNALQLSAHASVFQRLIQFQTDRVCLPARIDRESEGLLSN
jgi:glucose-6-phosphate isomerase